jgi:hypothetical protein
MIAVRDSGPQPMMTVLNLKYFFRTAFLRRPETKTDKIKRTFFIGRLSLLEPSSPLLRKLLGK